MTSPASSDHVKTGVDRIEDPLLNKDTAFTPEERKKILLLTRICG